MAKISVGISYTINYSDKKVQFGKLEVRIDELDLEQDVDKQLSNFDGAFDKAADKLKQGLVKKVKLG